MNTKTNNPTDCPKRMEFPVRVLEHYKDRTVAGEQQDQLGRAIALLKAHESMCECGTMPGDGNSALWDLERSLAGHKDMHTAFQGTPKGEYHAWAIREIEDALTILRNSMEAPKESHPMTATEVDAATFTHPLFGTPQWESFVNENWNRVRNSINEGHPDNIQVSTKTSNLTFSEALEAVKSGKTVSRPNGGSPLASEGGRAIWVSDMIATDWSVVEDGK